MCGIAGIVSLSAKAPVDEGTLLRMRDMLLHRGPDDAGLYIGPGAALGSRRLSILDLSSRGRMPMSTPDGRYHIVYNGEVYNYRELRPELESRGVTFNSNSDTEVVLHLFVHYGPSMLDKLNGMFALAIWDAVDRTLFLARDRLGIKPLYYTKHEDKFYFASEEKAFRPLGVPFDYNPGVWEELLLFRYVAGERTPFRNIHRLLPGHYMIWRNGDVNMHRWWNLGERAQELGSPVSDGNAVNSYRRLFDSSVHLRRISDVPLGVFLSGGLDSSSVGATLSLLAGEGVASFTMRFSDPSFDEGPLAEELSRRWGLDYHGLTVSPEDLPHYVDESSWFNDEPLVHGNDLFLYAIARYAKSRVTVLLSGEGADETLGGYIRYRPLCFPGAIRFTRPLMRVFPRSLASRLPFRAQKLARFLALGTIDRYILYNSCNILPDDLLPLGFRAEESFPYRLQVLDEAKRYSGEAVRQAMYLDQHTFLCSLLDRNDRMTMGASIECRVPFLDYRLVEFAAALPSKELFGKGRGKWILRRAMASRLPDSILKHPKWGFGVPWNSLFMSVPLLAEQLRMLPDREPFLSGPLDRSILRSKIKSFEGGNDVDGLLLLQFYHIARWYEVTFSRPVFEQRSGLMAKSYQQVQD